MKKINLFFFLLFAAATLSAQEGFKIGFRVAPLISSATIVDDETKNRLDLNQSGTIGFGYGVMANYGFTENYAIHTGAHIMYQSFSADVRIATDNDTVTRNADTRITTVELPLGIKLRSNEISPGIAIRGLFGLTLDVNTGYKQTGEGITENRNTNRINPLAASFFIGGGVEYEIDRVGTFDLGIRYKQGLLNVNDKEQGFNNAQVRLNYVALDLGYYF